MKRFTLSLLCLIAMASQAQAAILIESSNGTLVSNSTITTMAQACAQSRPIHITSPLSSTFSNISSSSVHGCSAPIVIHPGGSLGNTTAFNVNGPFSVVGGAQQVFAGSGKITFAAGSVPTVHVNWFSGFATDIGLAVNKSVASIKAVGGVVEIPSGSYPLFTSINMTGNQATKITVQGAGSWATIIGSNNAGGIVFDLTGSTRQELKDFTISGNQNSTPSVGIFLARHGAQSAEENHISNVDTTGSFSVAALYIYASEDFRATNCYLSNFKTNSRTVVATRTNIFSVTSPYLAVATGSQSNTDMQFIGGAINSYDTTGSSDNLYLDGVGNFSFTHGLMVNLAPASNTASYVHIDASTSSSNTITLEKFMIDGSNNTKYGFRISGSNTVAYLSIQNILNYGIATSPTGYTLHAPAGTSVFALTWKNVYSTSNGSNLLIDNLDGSDVSIGPGDLLNVTYKVSRSKISGPASGITVSRMEFSTTTQFLYTDTGASRYGVTAYALLGSVPSVGTTKYCSDCATTATCAGGGSGHMAVSNGTNWTCQ